MGGYWRYSWHTICDSHAEILEVVKEERLPQILEAYELVGAESELLLSEDNEVFRICTANGHRFMLRVNHGFDPLEMVTSHVGAELGWLKHIRVTRDLIVPRPVPLTNGDPYGMVEIDGQTRIFVLFEWIEGRPVSLSLSAHLARRMGGVIAILHRSAQDFSPPVEFCNVRWDEDAFFGPGSWIGGGQAKADLGSHRFGLVREASAKVQAAMAGLGHESGYFGLIHSDTHPSNMLISEGEIALIDFNDCGWGHYAFDLGVMLHDLKFMLMDQPSLYTELCTAVLAGYQEVTPLPLMDGNQIEAFIALRGLASLRWIARAPNPKERREALRIRPGVPFMYTELERFVASA